ncbi:MAG: phenylacetate--CoA ligase family protein, partial [Planctomycetes bacterium]|nr:phenylacetate--CoA ligase family protein [Planctomycetota bacterium]
MDAARWFWLYGRLPVGLQNAACSLYGLRMLRERFGTTFRRALAFLEESRKWSLNELRAYQDEQLRLMVRHAYDTVPYYRAVFEQRRLTPDDIRTVADLPKLPVLTKQVVRERFADLRSRGWPRRRCLFHRTSGTTGTALRLVRDRDTQAWVYAVVWRHRRPFGIDHREPFIAFGGRAVVPLTDMRPPFWRRNWSLRQTYVSTHHMTVQNMPALVDYLRTRRVAYYTGYPSALYLLAMFMLENDVRLPNPPRMVFTAAETLLDYQRQAITRGLGCDVADYYGA